MTAEQRPYVFAWVAIAIFSQLFLLTVSYTGASLTSAGQPIRDYLAPSIISSKFDQTLSIVADNLAWSVSTSSQIVGNKIATFLGVDQSYAFDQNFSGNLASQASLSPRVLGAHTASQ